MDILPFMGILIVLLFMFNSGLYIIQINRYLASDDALFPYEQGLMPMFVAGMLKEYYLLLGDAGDMNIFRNPSSYND